MVCLLCCLRQRNYRKRNCITARCAVKRHFYLQPSALNCTVFKSVWKIVNSYICKYIPVLEPVMTYDVLKCTFFITLKSACSELQVWFFLVWPKSGNCGSSQPSPSLLHLCSSSIWSYHTSTMNNCIYPCLLKYFLSTIQHYTVWLEWGILLYSVGI